MEVIEQLAMKLCEVYVKDERCQGDLGHTITYQRLSRDAQRAYLVLARFILLHVPSDTIIQSMLDDTLEEV